MTLFGLLMTLAFTQNVILVHFLGICPFEPSSSSTGQAHRIALLTMLVAIVVSVVFALITRYLIIPLGLEYLGLMVLSLIMAISYRGFSRLFTELFPFSIRGIRAIAPLVTVNATVLATALITTELPGKLYVVPVGAIAAGLGLYLALVPLAAIRQRMTVTGLPAAFRGDAGVFISAGILALILAGIDRALFALFPPLW